jgi:hypothetical protein
MKREAPYLSVAAWHGADGAKIAPFGGFLTKAGKKAIAIELTNEPQCVGGIITDMITHSSFSATFATSTLPPAWQTLLNQQDPANFTTASNAPVLIIQGSADTTVPPETSATTANALCALGSPQPLERWLYTGLDHISITRSNTINDIIQWMSDRFAGEPGPTPTRQSETASPPSPKPTPVRRQTLRHNYGSERASLSGAVMPRPPPSRCAWIAPSRAAPTVPALDPDGRTAHRSAVSIGRSKDKSAR